MSEREKNLVDKIAKLPDALQDKFLNMAQGATLALDVLQSQEADTKGKEGDEK